MAIVIGAVLFSVANSLPRPHLAPTGSGTSGARLYA